MKKSVALYKRDRNGDEERKKGYSKEKSSMCLCLLFYCAAIQQYSEYKRYKFETSQVVCMENVENIPNPDSKCDFACIFNQALNHMQMLCWI